MPLAMKADITEMVEPYYNKGKLENQIENAKAMKKKSLSNDMISEIVGLSIKDLKKYGVIQ